MGGRPPEHGARSRDVEDVVVVALIDHPGLDELVAAKRFVLQPGPGLGDRLWNAQGGPTFAVQSLSNDVLDLFVAQCVRLSHEHGELLRQGPAPIDDPFDRFGEILDVDEGLARAKHARV